MVGFQRKFLFLPMIRIFKYDVQNPFYSLVKNRFLQRTVLYGSYDFLVIYTAGRGHFQFQSGFQSGYTLVDRTPVGHHVSLEAPFVTQDICQQPGIFGGKGSVDPVVGAHKCVGLGFLYRSLECREIDFA